MATNQFNPHMGGQMMPQQQQQQQQRQQQQQQQQRSQNGNRVNAVQQMIFQNLSAQPTQHLTGWQTQMALSERLALVFSIVGNLQLASQAQSNPPDLQKMVQIAIRFEHEIFEKSVDKAAYKVQLDGKLAQLLNRRNENQAGLQLSIQNQAHAQAMAQQSRVAQQQMMMNQNMQGQVNRNMAQQPQPFQHLAHPMQASPIPGQLPPQMMGMQNDGLPQHMNPNQQQQFQMMHQHSQQQQGQQNMPGRPQPQMNVTQQDNDQINSFVEKMMAQATEEEKSRIRATIQGKMDPVQMQKYQVSGVDIATLYYRNAVIQKIRANKQQSAQLAAQQQGQNMQQHPQRSMNPSPLNGGQQPPAMTMGNQDPGFIESIAQQQQQAAALAANHGEMVVPVSNAPRNGTPQPSVMQNPRVQQQQQFVNAQQAQQAQHAQRLQQAAVAQQQQSQARLNAQAKTQQFALQGQPNGMGTGPMPPQPSPAMPNLNAPLRTPQMGNNPAPGNQMNPAMGQFGQPLNQQFMQGQNQRQMGPGPGDMNAMLANMPVEQRQQMSTLSPEGLQDMLAKWNENQRALQAQGMRPGMPMQGARSRQQFQPGFHPQAAAIQQFMANNPGQPLPPTLTSGMTPQQQVVVQQQLQKMQAAQQQNPNQMQRNMISNEQRILGQMDNLDFPPIVHTHTQMPRGIPVDVKKWGQLKQWVSTNPNLGPSHLDNIKSLQKMHYQTIAKSRQQNAGGGMVPGPRGGQPGMPGAPAIGAPVAQMGQQMPMAVRPVAQEEIDAMKGHPNFANVSEEQIRHFLQTRHAQMTPLQQQQRQQQLQNMRQANNNQARPALQQNNPATTPQMNIPAQLKAPQPIPEQPAQVPARPASRQQPPARNAAPTSSPAQPARNLKRASSDDVVEVPNPNGQQQQRPAPQQPQQPQGQSQPGQPRYTPQQVANLDPEARKKYESMMRARQAAAYHPADVQRIRTISEEELRRPADVGIQMDPETRQNTAVKLNSIVQPLTNVTKAIAKWFQITHDELRLRAFFRAKYRLQAQFKDNTMATHKDIFSIQVLEIEQARAMLESIVKDLSDKFPSMVRPELTQQQNANAPQAAAPVTPVPMSQPAANGIVSGMPLNAANLQQQQQQLKSIGHQRSNSTGRNSHNPPAAPTSAQPPFQFGANSPHGTPSYGGKSQITQENLQLPPKKKQKQGGNPASGQTTHGPNGSPEIRRDQIRTQVKPALVCLEAECDRHNVGFDTQEALNAHTQEEHIRPLNDSSKYAQENLASVLGLDNQGKPKKVMLTAPQDPNVTATAKQGQMSNDKAGSAVGTPMNRQVSMNRQTSTAGNRMKAIPSRDPPPGPKEVKQMAQPTQDASDPWANATIDPNDLYQAFQPFESGAGGAISDMNIYRSITPNDTPESSNHVSEPNSDISDGVALDISLEIFDDSWEPFGPGVGSGFELGDDENLRIFDDEQPNYSTWDDFAGSSGPDQLFSFDNSLFSMDAE